MTAMDAKYEYEYLVKYKNLSYLHIQWLSGAEIGTFCVLLLPNFIYTVKSFHPPLYIGNCRGHEPEEQGCAQPLPHQSG